MKLTVSIEQLLSYNLDIEQYMLCTALYTGDEIEMRKYIDAFGTLAKSKFEALIERKLIRTVSVNSFIYSNLRLNDDLFLELMGQKSVSEWIHDWFLLWPEGIKSGGYYIRTDEKGCKQKLIKFMKRNPQYGSDIIMNATQRYIFQRSLAGYEYTKLAPNFIELHGVSMLAGECENVLNNRETERPKIVQGELFGSNEL
jgi:hypothetical protein